MVVARWQGRVVAFANLMPAYGGGELSVDLMRQADDAPTGTMDLLFVTLIEHARAQGVPLFNLGMAPLSGVGQCRFAAAGAARALRLRLRQPPLQLQGPKGLQGEVQPDVGGALHRLPGADAAAAAAGRCRRVDCWRLP